MMKTDRSEQTVALRLKQVSQLRWVSLSLGRTRSVNRSESDREDHGDQITGKLKFSPLATLGMALTVILLPPVPFEVRRRVRALVTGTRPGR